MCKRTKPLITNARYKKVYNKTQKEELAKNEALSTNKGTILKNKTKNEQYHYDEYIDRMERPQGKHKRKTMKRERSPTMCLKQYNHIEEGRRMSLKNYVQKKRQSLQVLKRTTKLSGKSPKTRLKKLPAQLKEKNLVLTETEPQRRWP